MKRSGQKIADADRAAAGKALQRAALRAKELGLQTNTPVSVYRKGKTVDLTIESRRRAA